MESEKRLKDTATRSIRMAFEANSDGWWEWSRTQKKAFLSKKLCKTLGIEWGEGFTIKGFKECNADWWMAYITRDNLIEDFLNENIGRRKTIEVKYLRRNDRSEKYAII